MKTSWKKILIITSLMILLIAALRLTSHTPIKSSPTCQNGFIDLSNWDFAKYGNIKLDGYWEFYPNVLLSPTDFEHKEISQKYFIQIPGAWANQDTSGMISDKGIGTYRLKVKINPDYFLYGLKTMNIRTSCKIYVNGREVGSSGIPKESFAKGYKSNNIPVTAYFPGDTETLDILIQVANLDYINGGIIQNIHFGSADSISEYNLKCKLIDVITISFMFLSGIYCFGIFYKRREDKVFLYFSIMCTAYTYILSTLNEKISVYILPPLSFLSLLKIKEFMICVTILFMSLFIRELNKNFIPLTALKMIAFAMLFCTGLTLLLPSKFIGLAEKTTFYIYILIYLLIAIFILKAILGNKYGSFGKKATISLLLWVILFIIQFISAALYFNSMTTSNILPQITMLISLLAFLFILVEYYTRAYSAMEDMSLKLLAADKMKDEFLMITSHEFKTPLHAIINIAQVVLDQTNDLRNKKLEEDLSYIKSTAIRLSGLINDIIDFQSLQNNNLRFQKEQFDVNGAVQVALEILKYMKKSEDIQLINNISPDTFYVFTDENRFQQILFNLVGNSLKFMEKGQVVINAEVKEYFLYIYLTDTGIGIEKQKQAFLFSETKYREIKHLGPDFSENQSSFDEQFANYSTSGLGLPVSKLLANQMDGDLYLEWSTPDVGSSFTLKIPVSDYNKRNNKPAPSFTEVTELPLLSRLFKTPINKEEAPFTIQNGSTQKVKLLLVDDSVSNIKVLQEIFRHKDYETLVAYNGISALDLIKTHKDISLVLLDVMMPGLTGYEVCKEIRKKYQLYELPVLLLTVRNYPEDIEKGLGSGANDFLVKPFNAKELKARVATLLEIKKAVHNAITMESAFLRSQIKPHFLYNTLNIITSLCYSDGERAGMLLGELSNYLRGAFDVDPNNSFISLEKEISLVESYAALNKARFEERLQIDFNIEEAVLSQLIPAFIIQPLVENSIRHGLMKHIAGGKVEVSAGMNEGRLLIMVRDNGCGIPEEKLALLLDDNYSGSIGLKNVNKRLINEYGEGLYLESKEGEGTTIYISIPL